MSYDYTLFRPPADGPMRDWPAVEPPAIGSLSELRDRIAVLHPGTTWEEARGHWFGKRDAEPGCAEFQMAPDRGGLVAFLTVRRIGRAQVEALAAALHAVALDPQKMTLYRPAAGHWAPAE